MLVAVSIVALLAAGRAATTSRWIDAFIVLVLGGVILVLLKVAFEQSSLNRRVLGRLESLEEGHDSQGSVNATMVGRLESLEARQDSQSSVNATMVGRLESVEAEHDSQDQVNTEVLGKLEALEVGISSLDEKMAASMVMLNALRPRLDHSIGHHRELELSPIFRRLSKDLSDRRDG